MHHLPPMQNAYDENQDKTVISKGVKFEGERGKAAILRW
jgi:hypothetical protein